MKGMSCFWLGLVGFLMLGGRMCRMVCGLVLIRLMMWFSVCDLWLMIFRLIRLI